MVEPLPHQITAVYEEMLARQPLRFLLADDPGAGKTIMAGLLMKELIARGDLQRCLVVCPGSLAEQWQDELYRRFQLPFEILTNDKLEAARTGNWSLENIETRRYGLSTEIDGLEQKPEWADLLAVGRVESIRREGISMIRSPVIGFKVVLGLLRERCETPGLAGRG
jgi:SNF2 family DNA or RNA helicase